MKSLLQYIAVVSSFFLISCEKEIILEVADKEGEFVVVEAIITDVPGKQYVKLTQTGTYYSNEKPKAVSDATVAISWENGSISLTESNKADSAGYYFTPPNFAVQEGFTYSLNINTADRTLFSQMKAMPVPDIESLEIYLDTTFFAFFLPEEGDSSYVTQISYTPLVDKGNRYLFNLYRNNELLTVNPRSKSTINDTNFNGTVKINAQNFLTKDVIEGDSITIEMMSIDRNIREFYQVFFSQTDLSGNPFAGSPPANIPTNISEGGLGLFQVSMTKRKTAMYVSKK
jgi:hypothetical protein